MKETWVDLFTPDPGLYVTPFQFTCPADGVPCRFVERDMRNLEAELQRAAL